jgi:hypothetical protein
MVRAVIVMRIVGLCLLIALPLSPNFGLADVALHAAHHVQSGHDGCPQCIEH